MPELRTYPEGVPCWIDVEQPDLEAAQAFYSGLFDWNFRDAGPADAAAPYVVAELDGQPVAGLAAASNPSRPTWNTYVAVDDIDRVARKVRTAGGQVLAGP
jgi:predicted enzyme related to lactoylglutathione lyase